MVVVFRMARDDWLSPCVFQIVERRINLLAEEGINFVTNVDVGKDISGQQLLETYDAILLAIGSTVPRDLQIPGKRTILVGLSRIASNHYFARGVSGCVTLFWKTRR